MVRRDLKRRLRAIDVTGAKSGIEIWIGQGGGMVRGPRGEQMTREEAEALGALPAHLNSWSAQPKRGFDVEGS
jgi:hypothetical protein